MARLRKQYDEEIRERLKKRLGISNDLALPRLEKITVSCGVGGAKDNKKLLQDTVEILTRITGQRAVVTRARKPIAQFKLRAGMPTWRVERGFSLFATSGSTPNACAPWWPICWGSSVFSTIPCW